MEEEKSLKQYCKDAKNRLKHGFWQNYQTNVDANLKRAREQGISESKVREFYASKVTEIIRSNSESEDVFYHKVKKILDEEGEVSNVIGRLTDKNIYENMTYSEKQRYTLSLSEKYLKALERYKKEKAIGL